MPRKNTQRLTLDVGEQSFARIEKLQALMEDRTKTAVVCSALQLLEYMTDEVQRGSKFLVQLPNGTTERVQILGFNRAEG